MSRLLNARDQLNQETEAKTDEKTRVLTLSKQNLGHLATSWLLTSDK